MRGSDEKVIAIFVADSHFSLNPPVWRSAEPDWFEAMKRPLDEINRIATENNCPVIAAGDIFDRWNSPPELINFAIESLPESMYAIPGQHDLALHQFEDIKRSAFWTLVKAGTITPLFPNKPIQTNNLILHGFPFGFSLSSIPAMDDGKIHIAVVHDYIWIPNYCYPNAPQEKRLKTDERDDENFYYGYDIIVYGDNHKGFLTQAGRTSIFNCGAMMRRKSDEADYQPQIGLLLESGEIKRHYLDISKDKYLESSKGKQTHQLDTTAFMQELEKLGKSALDFSDAIKQYFETNKVDLEIQKVILEAMGK